MRIPVFVLLVSCALAQSGQASETQGIQASAAGQVTLTWTATGDDGINGRATRYDLRYSQAVINSQNFNSAIFVSGVPAPLPPSARETFTISNLTPSTTYYFAVKVGDEAGNYSPMSNVIQRVATGTVGVDDPGLTLAFSNGMPNPAHATTHFTLSVPNDAEATVEVFDVTGRRVQTLVKERLGPGRRDVVWNLRDTMGNRVQAGMYLVRAQVGDSNFTRRVIVMQ